VSILDKIRGLAGGAFGENAPRPAPEQQPEETVGSLLLGLTNAGLPNELFAAAQRKVVEKVEALTGKQGAEALKEFRADLFDSSKYFTGPDSLLATQQMHDAILHRNTERALELFEQGGRVGREAADQLIQMMATHENAQALRRYSELRQTKLEKPFNKE
jgi:hypothetical protein